jgi:hypothetical protein
MVEGAEADGEAVVLVAVDSAAAVLVALAEVVPEGEEPAVDGNL